MWFPGITRNITAEGYTENTKYALKSTAVQKMDLVYKKNSVKSKSDTKCARRLTLLFLCKKTLYKYFKSPLFLHRLFNI